VILLCAMLVITPSRQSNDDGSAKGRGVAARTETYTIRIVPHVSPVWCRSSFLVSGSSVDYRWRDFISNVRDAGTHRADGSSQ
jgi:hypothetical protein